MPLPFGRPRAMLLSPSTFRREVRRCLSHFAAVMLFRAWTMNAITASNFAPGPDGIRLLLVLFAGIRLKPEKIELSFYHLFLDAGISKDIVHDA
jgi:hypothetical protein